MSAGEIHCGDISDVAKDPKKSQEQRRALFAASTAHATHDGMSDLIYVMLPIWQSQFSLSYATAGLMRGVYSGVMASFQIKATQVARRLGRKKLLVGGTALSGLAYLAAGHAGALIGLIIALMLGGLGASTQHPLASSLVAEVNVHDRSASQSALSIYNFSGDVGKMLIPAAVGLALSWFSWQHCVYAVGLFGMGMAVVLMWLIPSSETTPKAFLESAHGADSGSENLATFGPSFYALLCTGVLDSATRMGFLTFLPFILGAKQANAATIGLALSLLFIGGAVGKLVCGYFGRKIGMLKTVWISEAFTAACILGTLTLPLNMAIAALPLLGVALNGTSSVLYGSVPVAVSPQLRERAFAIFYTGTIGAGSIAPILFGYLGDLVSVERAMQCLAGFVCLTIPSIWIAEKTVTHN